MIRKFTVAFSNRFQIVNSELSFDYSRDGIDAELSL